MRGDVEIGGDVGEGDAAGDLGLEFEEEAIAVGRIHAVEAVGEFDLVEEGLLSDLVDGGFEPGYLLIECEKGVFADRANGGVAGGLDAGVCDRSVVEALKDSAELKGLQKIVGDLDAFVVGRHDAEHAVANEEAMAADMTGPKEIVAFVNRFLSEGVEDEPAVVCVNGMIILKIAGERVFHSRKYPNFRANRNICR